MRLAIAIAAAAGLCSPMLASCSGTAENPSAGAQPSSSTSTSTTTSTSGSSRSSPSPTPTTRSSNSPAEPAQPPAMPALAKDDSRAGAKAFVRYYVDIINYGYLSGDATALLKLGAKTCAVCSALARNVDQISNRGGEQVGGQWSVKTLNPIASGSESLEIFIAKVEVAKGRSRATRTSPAKPIKPSASFYEIHVSWTGSSWTTQDLRPA